MQVFLFAVSLNRKYKKSHSIEWLVINSVTHYFIVNPSRNLVVKFPERKFSSFINC